MVKFRITRAVSEVGVAAVDPEAIVTVGIRSIRRGVVNVESINVGFCELCVVNPILID